MERDDGRWNGVAWDGVRLFQVVSGVIEDRVLTMTPAERGSLIR
jgi:hypothetical protein